MREIKSWGREGLALQGLISVRPSWSWTGPFDRLLRVVGCWLYEDGALQMLCLRQPRTLVSSVLENSKKKGFQ